MVYEGRGSFPEMKPKMNEGAGVVVQTKEELEEIMEERWKINTEEMNKLLGPPPDVAPVQVA